MGLDKRADGVLFYSQLTQPCAFASCVFVIGPIRLLQCHDAKYCVYHIGDLFLGDIAKTFVSFFAMKVMEDFKFVVTEKFQILRDKNIINFNYLLCK